MRSRAAIVFASLAGACGIDAVGTLDVGGVVPPPSGSLPDADAPITDGGELDADQATDGSVVLDANVPDASACSATGTACSAALAAGWTPLAFAANRNATCLGGYTAVDLVVAPVANAGACTCACQIAVNDPSSCAKGSFASLVGSTTCNGNGQTFTVNGTGCTVLAVQGGVSAFGNYAAFALTRGTCNSSVTKDDTKLATTAVRGCLPPAGCAEDVCLGTSAALGPYGSCIVHDGDVACPAGPFVNRSLAGASGTLSCGGCATCQNEGTCGTATVRFYNDAACATQIASRVANGACNALATGAAGNNATHYEYDVAVTNQTCAPTSSPTTTAGLDQPRTICCR